MIPFDAPILTNPAPLMSAPVLSAYGRMGGRLLPESIVVIWHGYEQQGGQPFALRTAAQFDGAISTASVLIGSRWPNGTGNSQPLVKTTEPTSQSIESPTVEIPRMLFDIRRIMGWSWDTLSSTLGVSRQAVHLWTLGNEIKQSNQELLAKLYSTITFLDRGSAELNRALLAQPGTDGRTALEMLQSGEFEAVRKLLGEGVGRPTLSAMTTRPEVSEGELHWFDRLRLATGSEDNANIEFVPYGRKRRLALRRR